jgi:hypothetical protein
MEIQLLCTQFAPHARQMPTVLMIMQEAVQMQPDAIKASEIADYNGVACGLRFGVGHHTMSLLLFY